MKKRVEQTIIMRREFHQRGWKGRRKMIKRDYPKVQFKKSRISDSEKDMIFKLYHAGWKINWIAKKLKLDWHTVKYHIDSDYKKKKLEWSSKRIKSILADPIERKKQFARVDSWKRKRLKKDKKYRKYIRGLCRKAGKKYDEKNREKRRKKALERYRKLQNRHISTNIDNR
jgi:hypothetical protein